jgi:hypothetical protein
MPSEVTITSRHRIWSNSSRLKMSVNHCCLSSECWRPSYSNDQPEVLVHQVVTLRQPPSRPGRIIDPRLRKTGQQDKQPKPNLLR